VSTSRCASSIDTPSFKRPITREVTLTRDPAAKSTRIGVHTSGARSMLIPGGNRISNDGSSTPMTSIR
jgi:hypothetical protein